MLQDLLMPVVRVMARLLLLWLKLWGFVTNLPTILSHKVLRLLTLHKKDWIELIAAVIVIASLHVLRLFKDETNKLKEINAKFEVDHERNVARKTIRFNGPPQSTYGEGAVVKGIHIIGTKFDMVINGMEIAGGHRDGRHRARVRGADERSKFGSQLVINMNDITEEVVKSGGNVDLEWTLEQRT